MDSERLENMLSYDLLFSRNIGFVSENEQKKIKSACVLILGVGGMGGAAFEVLVRSGVGSFIIADPDTFEIHNMNRQIALDSTHLGKQKVEVWKSRGLLINPEVKITAFERLTGALLEAQARNCTLLINGCDDPQATIELHRLGKKLGKTVLDAAAATLPNVIICHPDGKSIEGLFQSPTLHQAFDSLTAKDLKAYSEAEVQFAMIHSSSRKHVNLDALKEFLAGSRKRFSFAPMVIMTGTLMDYEAIKIILGTSNPSLGQIFFYNPWNHQVERPKRGIFKLIAMIRTAWWARVLR